MPLRVFVRLTTACLCLCLAKAPSARASLADDLQAMIDEVPKKKVPGVLLYVHEPELTFLGTSGFADRKTKAPLRGDHTLRIASVGKTYVSALAQLAANDGLTELDQTIDHYLDQEILSQLPDALRPTIRQLLNHTSGIPDYYGVRFYLTDWQDRGPLTLDLVLRAIRGKKATHRPGEVFSYSNTNYHLVAAILEKVHATDLATLLKRQLFVPLALNDTYYNERSPRGDDIHGYGAPMQPWVDTYDWQENSGPDSGIKASAADVAKWIRALFSDDGALAAIGQQMTNAPVQERTRKLQGMGVEILESRSGVQVVGHTGGADGYLTAAFYIRESDLVFVLHINKSDEKRFSALLSQTLKTLLSQ